MQPAARIALFDRELERHGVWVLGPYCSRRMGVETYLEKDQTGCLHTVANDGVQKSHLVDFANHPHGRFLSLGPMGS